MMYDAYVKKIEKLARYKNLIIKHKVIIIISFCTLISLFAAFCGTKGMIIEDISLPETIYYGEEFSLNSNALFSQTILEFKNVSSSTWSKDYPVEAGEYNVRTVSNRVFGMKNYGDVQTFTILPKNVNIEITSSSITYGEDVLYEADLVNNDYINNIDFILDEYNKEKTNVMAIKDSIIILNENNVDVTKMYNIETPKKEVEVLDKKISIKPNDFSFVYGDDIIIDSEYQTTGNIVIPDIVSFELEILNKDDMVLNDIPKIPGNYKLRIKEGTLNVFKDTLDVSNMYEFEILESSLIIDKRDLHISTSSVTSEYSAKDISCLDYILVDSSLVNDDELVINTYTTLKNVGTVYNVIEFSVSNNNETVDYYNITCDYGTITITPAPILVKTDSKEFVYDGEEHEYFSYSITGNYYDEDLELVSSLTKITNYGSIENQFTLKNDNYKIEYEYGLLKVNKREAEIILQDITKVYDGSELNSNNNYLLNNFVSTDYVDIRTNSLTDYGTIESRILSFEIYNKNQEIINQNYEIKTTNASISIFKRDLTISPIEVTTTYNGSIYQYDNTRYDIIDGSFVGNDDIEIITYFNNLPLNAGTYEIYINSINFIEGLESNYNITYNDSILTINKVNLTISPIDVTTTYNANIYQYDNTRYDIIDGSFVLNDDIEITTYFNNLPLNAGTYKIYINSVNFIEGLESNYNITYLESTLEIEKYTVEVRQNNGSSIYNGTKYVYNSGYEFVLENKFFNNDRIELNVHYVDEFNNIVDPINAGTYKIYIDSINFIEGLESNYNVTYDNDYYSILTINKVNLTISPIDVVTTYNGNIYQYDNTRYDIIDGSFVLNDDIEIITYFSTLPLNAGTYQIYINSVNFIEGLESNYNITYLESTLTILKRNVTIKPFDVTTTYNGEVVSYSLGYELIGDVDFVEDIEFDVYFLDMFNNSILPINAGIYKIVINEIKSDYLDNYDITRENGILTINKVNLTISPIDVTTIYNGNIYQYDNTKYDIIDGNFIGNDDIEITTYFTTLPLNAGTYEIYIYSINFIEGLESNYNITYEYSMLTINKANLLIELNDIDDYEYDGTIHAFNEGYNIVDGILYNNDTLSINYMYSYYNDFRSFVTPRDANTYYYSLNEYYINNLEAINYEVDIVSIKSFTITPRKVSVSLISETIEYNGQEYSYDTTKYNIIIGSFVNNDRLQIEVGYSSTPYNVGEYDVYVTSFNIKNGDNNNYEITFYQALVTISKRIIVVSPVNDSYEYDGNAYVYDSSLYDGSIVGNDKIVISVEFSTEPINVGIYDIYVIDVIFVEGLASNYDISYGQATVEITKRTIKVSPIDITSTYNSLAYEYDGNKYEIADGNLVDGDEIYINIRYGSTPINVGEYDIYIESIDFLEGLESNYDIFYGTSILTINKADLIIDLINPSDKEYDGKIYDFDVSYNIIEGLVYNFDQFKFEFEYSTSENFVDIVEPLNSSKYYARLVDYETTNQIYKNYNIVANNYITFEITKIDLEISLIFDSIIVYTGNPYEYQTGINNYELIKGNLVEKEELEIFVIYKDIDQNICSNPCFAGKYYICFNDYVTYKSGVLDEQKNYNIVAAEAYFEIVEQRLTIKPIIIEDKIYDGLKVNYIDGINNYVLLDSNFDTSNLEMEVFVQFYSDEELTIIVDPINVGKYYVKIINTLQNQDVVVDISDEIVSFEITKREVQISFDDKEKIYDGTLLEFKEEDALISNIVNGHTISFNSNGIINVGYIKGDISDLKIMNNDIDETNNYDIVLEVNNLIINKAMVDINIGNYNKTYDNKEFSHETIRLDIFENDYIEYDLDYYQENRISAINAGIYVVKAININCSSENFDYNFTDGKLTIDKLDINLILEKNNSIYDGINQNSLDNIYLDSNTLNELNINNYILNYDIDLYDSNNNLIFEAINVGLYYIDVKNINVKHNDLDISNNFNYIYQVISFEITKRKVSISTGSLDVYYNGLGHYSTEYEITDLYYQLLPNDTIDVLEYETFIYASEYKNNLTFIINDSILETNNYDLIITPGTININRRPIKINSDSTVYVYGGNDGKTESFVYESFTVEEYNSLNEVALLENHRVEVLTSTTVFNSGVYKNVLEYIIYDEFGQNIVENYLIDDTNCGIIEVTKRNVEISLNDGKTEYTSNDYIFSTKDLSYKELEFASFDNIKLIVSVNSTQYLTLNFVGEYIVTLQDILINNESYTINENYQITITDYESVFEVTKKTLNIKTQGETRLFDNSYWTNTDYSFDGLCKNDSIMLKEETFVYVKNYVYGGYENSFEVYLINNSKEDVTSNYDIIYEYGILNVDNSVYISFDYELVYIGTPYLDSINNCIVEDKNTNLIEWYESDFEAIIVDEFDNQINPINVGTYKLKSIRCELYIDGIMVNEYLDINYLDSNLKIKKRSISIKPIDKEKVYDGLEFKCEEDEYEILSGSLAEGQELKIETKYTISSSITRVYSNNQITGYKIYDINQNDVSDCYDVTYSDDENKAQYYARLAVLKRTIYVKTGSASKVYDGEKLYCDEFEILEKDTINKLVKGHTVEVLSGTKFLTNVGSIQNRVVLRFYDSEGKSVSGYLVIYEDPGYLTVTQREIVIETSSASKLYDGIELTSSEYQVNGLVDGHYISSIEITGTITEVGQTDNTVDTSSIVIKSESNSTVTRNYSIKIVEGVLTIT